MHKCMQERWNASIKLVVELLGMGATVLHSAVMIA